MAEWDRGRYDDRYEDRWRDRWGSGDYRQNYDYERGHGASGNYFGGGGYGSMRDYDAVREADAGYGRPSYRGRGPKNYQRSDERLRELVSERLEEDDDVDASDIEVLVSDGEVTLNGTVDSRRTKRRAEDLAAITYGVKDVHNNLRVDHGFFSRVAETVRDAVHRDR